MPKERKFPAATRVIDSSLTLEVFKTALRNVELATKRLKTSMDNLEKAHKHHECDHPKDMCSPICKGIDEEIGTKCRKCGFTWWY